MVLNESMNSKQAEKNAFITLISKATKDKLYTTEGKENRKRKRQDSSSPKKKLKKDQAKGGNMSEELQKEYKEFLKKRDIARLHLPVCSLLPLGRAAQLTVEPEQRKPLKLSDIQDVLMFSSLNQQSYMPRWCKVKKIGHISRILCIIVEGISVDDYLQHQERMSQVKGIYDFHLEVQTTTTTDSSVTEGLGAVRVTENQKTKIYKGKTGTTLEDEKSLGFIQRDFKNLIKPFAITREENQSTVAEKPKKTQKKDRCKKKQLLLSLEEMVKIGYPVPHEKNAEKYEGYKMVKERYSEVTDSSPMFALDCEMCKTTSGTNEVTRISVVDESLQVVYHSYVKPHNKIIDYLTSYSAVMEESLEGVTTTLEDVQAELDNILPADAILVGHYLISDFHALKVMHPYVIDTAFIFNLSGFVQTKPALSLLSQVFLNERIQAPSSVGHDPTEDSIAAIKLVNLKLRKDLSYGNAVVGGYIPPIDDEMACYAFSIKLMRMMEINNVSGLVISHESLSAHYKESFAPKEEQNASFLNNKQVVSAACERMLESLVIIVGLDMRKEKAKGLEEKHMKSLDKRLSKLYHHADYKSMVIVLLTGSRQSSQNGVCLVKIKPDPSLPYWTWEK